MTDFSLFEKVLSNYEEETQEQSHTSYTDTDCNHNEVTYEGGMITCDDCGEELSKTIQHEKEWRYYGPSDTKRGSDPNRVQMRRETERSIFKDVENMNFSDKIVFSANNIYSQVTKGQIFRGATRRAIIFACIFHAYKLSGKPEPHENLIRIFSLNRKTGLKGLKLVNVYAPKSLPIHTTYITPAILIDRIMDRFSSTESQKQEVRDLYEKVKNRSSKLNRARPQSVACGTVYYWMCKTKKTISLKNFSQDEEVKLSELTISKMAKEISKVLQTPDIL